MNVLFEYRPTVDCGSPAGWCLPDSAQGAECEGSAKTGQAALKIATGVKDLSHHLHTSKKRSLAPLPPY